MTIDTSARVAILRTGEALLFKGTDFVHTDLEPAIASLSDDAP